MKFAEKIFFCTMIVMALAMGVGGYVIIQSTFTHSLNREIQQSLDERKILVYTIQTVSLNYPFKYDNMREKNMEKISASLESGRYIRISDGKEKKVYESEIFKDILSAENEIGIQDRGYRVIKKGEQYFIFTIGSLPILDQTLYLETLREISTVFLDRQVGFGIYKNITMLTLFCGAMTMYLLSLWLTRPIKTLQKITQGVAKGAYDQRAKIITTDEVGLLAEDFNKMADALEEKINQLKEEVAHQERFVGAFSHEIKTPLTAVIGYADLLRRNVLNEEQYHLSVEYIYSQGKRLEELSLRLLDIIVLKNTQLQKKKVPIKKIFDYLAHTFPKITTTYEEGVIEVEFALLTSVLFNLVDNGRKASGESHVYVSGEWIDGKYRFTVKDQGYGIAEEEIIKLTEAFYMVDKSRARKDGGAGLGLTLCAEILKLHDSHMEIQSEIGIGTTVSFTLSV